MTTHEEAGITDAAYTPPFPEAPVAAPDAAATRAELPAPGARKRDVRKQERSDRNLQVRLEKDDARTEPTQDGPSWWHRDHAVFTPLAGFFTGLLLVIVLPLTYAAILQALVPDDKLTALLPVGLVVLLIPIVLLILRRTRRFAKYMLIGMLATAVVVALSASGTFWFLYHHNG